MKTHSENKTLTTSDNVKIIYNIHRESENKPLLVFIHGLGGDLTVWNEEREYFHERHYSTLSIDLRGHGLSDRIEDSDIYTLTRFADDIVEILQKEKIKNPIIIGHCFGGIVSIYLEALHNIAQKLILVDTGYKAPPLSSAIFDHKFLRWLHKIMAPHSSTAHVHKHRDFSQYKGTSDYDVRRLLSDVVHTSLSTYFLCSSQLMNLDARDLLKKITIPTLVIEGSDDAVFPPEMARDLADKIHHSKFKIIHKANHILVLNNPLSLSKVLEEFIEEEE